MTETPPPPPDPAISRRKRMKMMALTLGIFLFLGLIFLVYWLVWARYYEYTNDAYVSGNKVMLTPQIPGIVVSLGGIDTDFVCKGKVLVELDKADATIDLEKSIAELGENVRQVARLFERVKELEGEIAAQKAEFVKAAQDYEHRMALIESGGVSIEDLEHSEAALQSSFAQLFAKEHAYIGAIAQVENTTIATHPLVMTAKNKLRAAYLFLQRTTLVAPVSGIVAQRSVQVGQQVKVGQPLLAIVPLDQMWIDANFKEVQLTKVRIGQPAKVTCDLYGSGLVFEGKVVGIGGGTGSTFSVLPPQNATGNWIKIVQRVPVKVALDPKQMQTYPLRLGLSTEVTVDLHNTQLPLVPAELPDQPLYETSVYEEQEEGVEALIEEVIQANISVTFIEDFQQEEDNEG